jgi:hypothetical protein
VNRELVTKLRGNGFCDSGQLIGFQEGIAISNIDLKCSAWGFDGGDCQRE